MIDIQRIESWNSPMGQRAMGIREEVFIKGQHVDPALERDQYDVIAHHYLALMDDKAIGTARWRETSEGIKLERFAVLKPYRNQKIGEALLMAVMEDVIPQNRPIYLNAQIRAIPFYERHGFVVQGDPFFEAEIKHLKMIYASPITHRY
jgi:predicted GNAT family N-acyltransferase